MSEISPTPSPQAVFILGMHRSGTSALARIVNLLGVDFSTDLLGPRPDNPRGFWEHRQIVELHDELLDSLNSSFDDFLPLPNDWLMQPQTNDIRQKLIQNCVRRDFANSSPWGFKDPRTCPALADVA